MCNGELSSSIRIHREHRPALVSPYDDAFFEQLEDFLPHLERVMFLGGEPFLGAEPLRVMDLLLDSGLTPHCVVTTNGTQWNDRIERILSSLPMDVYVSVDGRSDEVIRSIRVGADRPTLERNIGRYLAATRSRAGELRLTFCLMRQNWHEFGAVLGWADELDVDVHVNDVSHPAGASLLHAPLDVLDHVVGALRAEGTTRARSLDRNAHVWHREVERLEDVLSARVAAGEQPAPTGGTQRRARRSLAAGTTQLRVDGSNIVRSIEPDPTDVAGVDVSSCVGDTSASLLDTLMSVLGRLAESSLRHCSDGSEEREFVLVQDDGTSTRIVATMTPIAEGELWSIGSEQVDGPTPGPGRASAGAGSTPVVLRTRLP
jgi:hypothetical protein